MTHSLKVAQVARALAEMLVDKCRVENKVDLVQQLGGIDPSVAEAAGLAHDLGHPPFGHAGEDHLRELTSSGVADFHAWDGFEGNAQSFRIATGVEGSFDQSLGLRLTAGTRTAILKYPWKRGEMPPANPNPTLERRRTQTALRMKKYGFYGSETEKFLSSRAWLNPTIIGPQEQSLEASIMDIADDITYAIHDLEDYLLLGVINRDTVIRQCALFAEGHESGDIQQLALSLQKYEQYDRSELVRACKDPRLEQLPHSASTPAFLRRWRNTYLSDFLSAVKVHEEPTGDVGARVRMHDRQWHTIELLKYFSRAYVVERRDLALMQKGQIGIITRALSLLREWANGALSSRIPIRLRWALDWAKTQGHEPNRAYLDYICMLGDEELLVLVNELSGLKISSILNGFPS